MRKKEYPTKKGSLCERKKNQFQDSRRGLSRDFVLSFQGRGLSQNAERGIGKLTLLVFGLLVFAVLFSAYHIAPFYYYYFELKNHMRTVIRVASTNSDQEVRQKLMYHIKKMQIPMDPEDLKIERDEGVMRISLAYDEVFYITWNEKDYDIHTFHFHAYEEGAF
jgi:hypothetical protein